MPENTPSSSLDTLQKFAMPLAIVVAGALIAGAVFMNGQSTGTPAGSIGRAAIEIRPIRAEDHVRGDRNAEVVILEFSDTECPFCKQFHNTVQQIMDTYEASGEVAWGYRHLPLVQLHPKAAKEAEALECAAEQGGSGSLGSSNDIFWQYTDKLYATTNSNNSLDIGVYNAPATPPTGPDGKPYYTQKTPRSTKDAGQLTDLAVSIGLDKERFENCLAAGTYTAHVATDTNEAVSSGGNGTPYSIFISKNKIPKATEDILTALIPSVGPDTFVISEDGYRISMSGSLPFDMVEQILSTILE